MSTYISNSFVTQFASEVKVAYQASSKLMNTVRTRMNVVGSTVKFPVLGKGLAQPRITQADVTPMNVMQNDQTAVLSDWNASEYTDIFDQQKINFDEKRELVKVVSSAIGRRLDQIVINAIATGAGQTIGVNVGGNNTGINVAKILAVATAMNAAGVPMENRHMAISAYGLSQMLSTQQLTDINYNSVKSLVRGEIDTWMGFNFHVIEDRLEGGVPIAANTRSNYAWHKDAVGLAVGIGPSTEINYIPEKTSWLTTGKLSAGATVIDSQGVFIMQSYEA